MSAETFGVIDHCSLGVGYGTVVFVGMQSRSLPDLNLSLLLVLTILCPPDPLS